MRLLLTAVLGFTALLLAQTLKDKKIQEIDQRIAALQKEIEGLRALRNVVSSGQLPESALNQIAVGSGNTGDISAQATGSSVSSSSRTETATQSSSVGAQSSTAAVPAAGGTPTGQTTSKGQTIYEGPKGGRYHYSESGKKVYERRK